MGKKLGLSILIGLFLFAVVARASDFSSTNFTVKDPVIDLGGVLSGSNSFNLTSSLGQEAIGVSVSNTLGLKSGFLYFPSPSVTTPTPPAGPPPSSGGGFYGKPIIALRDGGVCDLNSDGRCNIFDLSIFLYWMDKSYNLASNFDLNKDGHLDIADISLIFYYWT